jgi:arylsulfatase A-like enzyme
MGRRLAPLIGALTLVLGVVVTVLGTGCGRGRRFDNLLVITIDTLRADHLGVYGYPRATSTFLDRLGREGVVFRHAYAASSHTGPSHASLFTGLYPEQHQVLKNGQLLHPQVPSLARLFAEGGFETAAFASARFLSTLGAGFTVVDTNVPVGGTYRRAGATIDAATEWLRRREQSRPFVLWVHLYDPHEYRPEVGVPGNPLKKMEADSAARGAAWLEWLRREHGYTAEALDPRLDRYDAQIAYADSQLRRLFEVVRETGGAGRTLAVITADHGEGLTSHGYMSHGEYLYNEQLHVPLILWDGGRSVRPASIEQLVRHVDVLPTLVALFGLEPRAGALRCEGRSLATLVDGARVLDGPETAFAQRRPADDLREGRGWTQGRVLASVGPRYKYIFNEGAADELYDLERDRLERHNLLVTPPAPEDAPRLRAWLLAKHEALSRDRRAPAAGEIDATHLEELRALGYF